MTEPEQKWIETNRSACAVLRQLHDMLALSSLPPRRTWVGLTDEEISDMFCVMGTADADINLIKLLTDARRIEAKLKEKNNG
jgi:hypothetical protein